MDTLVVGLDGCDWKIIKQLIKENKLPTIEKLIEGGISGSLESTIPQVSPAAWSSIHTGTNPGKHGILDFGFFHDNYQWRPINSTDRKMESFWTILNDQGIKTDLFKIPFTYPPEEVDGYIMSGFPFPTVARDFAQPPSLTDKVGNPSKLFADLDSLSNDNHRSAVDGLIEVSNTHTNLLLEVLNQHETDFLMTVYDEPDKLHHFFWKYFDENHPNYIEESDIGDPIADYYEKMDANIARLIEKSGDNCNIIIISDHGFGPVHSEFYIEQWLADSGYLSWHGSLSPQEIMLSIVKNVLKMTWDATKRAGLGSKIKKLIPDSMFESGAELVRESKRISIDWSNTSCFFTTKASQGIYINLDTEFIQGTISKKEYDEFISELKKNLNRIEHPESREQIIQSIHHREDIYKGGEISSFPDLILETHPEFILKGGKSNQLFKKATKHSHSLSGDHRKNGIFIANGSAFSQGTINDASVIDIAPTLLHISGCDVPKLMDGEVLVDALSEEYQSTISYTDQFGDSNRNKKELNHEEQEKVKERLEKMGYLR